MSVKSRKLCENFGFYTLILQPTKEKLVIRLSLFRFNQKMQSRCEPRLHFFMNRLLTRKIIVSLHSRPS